ncbi:hypothetical protein LTR62_006065 [Meristemomyces frigidus]|uniref:Uncharacterized protein n=1 Tax=Meristemomyces frigidus TaxID=1508187 RepID=A0AAN7TD03_9PEZI|nr:hypothetical protein LTR62_006065 [Meristemomyces frigidus]
MAPPKTPKSTPRPHWLAYYEDLHGTQNPDEIFDRFADVCEDESNSSSSSGSSNEEDHNQNSANSGLRLFKPFARPLTKEREAISPMNEKEIPLKGTTGKKSTPNKLGMFGSRASTVIRDTGAEVMGTSSVDTGAKGRNYSAQPPSQPHNSTNATPEASQMPFERDTEQMFTAASLADEDIAFGKAEEDGRVSDEERVTFVSDEDKNRGGGTLIAEKNANVEGLVNATLGVKTRGMTMRNKNSGEKEGGLVGEIQEVDGQGRATVSGARAADIDHETAAAVKHEGYQGDREEMQQQKPLPKGFKPRRAPGLLAEAIGSWPTIPAPREFANQPLQAEPRHRTRATTLQATQAQRPTTRSGSVRVTVKPSKEKEKVTPSKRNKLTARAATLQPKKTVSFVASPGSSRRMGLRSTTTVKSTVGDRVAKTAFRVDGETRMVHSKKSKGLWNWRGERVVLGKGEGWVVVRK